MSDTACLSALQSLQYVKLTLRIYCQLGKVLCDFPKHLHVLPQMLTGPNSLQEDGYAVPVAEINKIKKPTLGRNQPIPSHIDSYSLHTLPGIDSLFMLAVTVALDESIFSPQQMQPYGYPGYGRMGYGGMGYRGMGYGGMGYGYGAPMLLGGALLGASPFLLGGFW